MGREGTPQLSGRETGARLEVEFEGAWRRQGSEKNKAFKRRGLLGREM